MSLFYILQSSRLDLLELMLNSEFDPNTDTNDIGKLGASDSVVRKRLLTNDVSNNCMHNFYI